MPTPDASAFTRQKKLSSHQAQTPTNTVKPLSHLYQPIIRTSGLTDFLPSFSNKNISLRTGSLPWSKSGPNLGADQSGGQVPKVAYIDKKRLL